MRKDYLRLTDVMTRYQARTAKILRRLTEYFQNRDAVIDKGTNSLQ
jgi:hypothetical protein